MRRENSIFDGDADTSVPAPGYGGRPGTGGGVHGKDDPVDSSKVGKEKPGKSTKVWHRDAKAADGGPRLRRRRQLARTGQPPCHRHHRRAARSHSGRSRLPQSARSGSSKAPSSIRCRPGPAPATSPCSSARRATTVPPRFFGRGDAPALPADALAQLPPEQLVKNVDTTDWGTAAGSPHRQQGKSPRNLRGHRPRPDRSGPAGIRRRQHLPRPGLPHRPPRAITASSSPTRSCCRSAGDQHALSLSAARHASLARLKFTLQANTAECKDVAFPARRAGKDEGGSQLRFTRKTWKDERPRRRGAVSVYAGRCRASRRSAASRATMGRCYIYARLRPERAKRRQGGQAFASHAVFLLDTSLSDHPDRFDVSMKLLQTHPGKRCGHQALQCADLQRRQRLARSRRAGCPTPPAGARQGVRQTGRHRARRGHRCLVRPGQAGASPASTSRRARRSTASCSPMARSPGAETNVSSLVARFERRCPFSTHFHCYRTGLGAENLELFDALTRRGGGIFNCFGEPDLAKRSHGPSQSLLADRQRAFRRRTASERCAGRRPQGSGLSRRRADRRGPAAGAGPRHDAWSRARSRARR